jgi:hypothetical protein
MMPNHDSDHTPFDNAGENPGTVKKTAGQQQIPRGRPSVGRMHGLLGADFLRPRLPRLHLGAIIGLSMIAGAVLSLLLLSAIERNLPTLSSPYMRRRDNPAASTLTLVPAQPAMATGEAKPVRVPENSWQAPLTYTVPPVPGEDPTQAAERRMREERRIQDENAAARRQLEDKKRAIERQLEDKALEEKRRLEDKAIDDQRQADDLKAIDARRVEDQRLEQQRKVEEAKNEPAT